jgi:tRNA(Ile)-lysidine synthase
VVALSGGPDSTALAYLVSEARDDLGLVLVHVRHGLRDDTEDQQVVATHASWLGVPLEVVEVEVRSRGEGVAAAARHERYRALRRVAAQQGARSVLVGHTAEDQAETLLLRLARGSGPDGLTGMRRRAGDLVRPLLGLRRADVHRFVLLEGLPSVADPSNDDPTSPRAQVRHRLLPLLATVGPDPVAALNRLADLAADETTALEAWAASVSERARWVGPVAAIADRDLAEVPVAVARRVLRRLVVRVGDGRPPSADAVARVAGLHPGGAVDLPAGVRATAAAGWTALAPRQLPEQAPTAITATGASPWAPAGVAVTRHGPGDATPSAGGQIALELAGAWTPPRVEVDAPLPPGALSARGRLAVPEGLERLWLRHRRPGDRLRLPAGGRRLKDLLIDVGVPRPMRALWPVVVDADDRPVWVPGIAADEHVLRDGRARPAALLALARLE